MVEDMEHSIIVPYLLTVVFLVPLVNVWASLQEWPREFLRQHTMELEARFVLTCIAFTWPVVLALLIVYFVGWGVFLALALTLRDAPRALQRRHRKRVARAETAAKEKAEAARYEVERGAHR